MRSPARRPRRHEIFVTPDADLGELAGRARYVGSAEHKTYPSPAGAPRPRADATKCDPTLHGNFEQLTEWLRAGIAAGRVGAPWEGEFPRYVWTEEGGRWYEGRLVNRMQGTYKGYEVEESELPVGL